MLTSSRVALLSLLALTTACTDGQQGDTDSDTDTDAAESTGVPDSPSSSGASDSDPGPTGGGESEVCTDPEMREDVDFVFEHDTLPFFTALALDCVVDGTSGAGEGGVSAAIDLTCTDKADVSHVVRIELKLFHDATLVLAAGDLVTLVYQTNQDIGDYREWINLRGQDDVLKLFAMRGYSALTPEAAPLWDPLVLAPVTNVFCLAEDLGQCHTERRVGLDVTLGGDTKRLFDRSWATFDAGLTVHLGKAKDVDRHPNPGCIDDSVDGLEMRMVAVGEQ